MHCIDTPSGFPLHTRRYLPILSLLLICLSFSAKAQVERRGFYITDSASRVPITEASVLGNMEKLVGNADENGYVSLKNLPDGATSVRVVAVGYESKLIDLARLPKDGFAVIYLAAKISSLGEITIKASSNNGIFRTISDLDVHVRPINNSQEVLRMVPGLFIGQHAGGGKSEQIFLRGFDCDHGTDINITVDGIPVNMVSHAHGQGYADLHWVIPELIEKVTFNKGPYFADKGNFTTAGYVAFQTKNYLDNNFVKLERGQFGTYRAIAGINLLKKQPERQGQSLYVAGEASSTQGYFENPQDFKRYNGLLRYHGQVSKASTLTASLTAFTSRWNASGQIPDRAVEEGIVGFYGAIDNTEGGQTSRYNAIANMVTQLGNGATLTNSLYYTRNNFELYSNFTFYKQDTVNGDQIRQAEHRNMAGYNGSYAQEYKLGGMATQTTAGVQLRYDDVRELELTRTQQRTINNARIMFGNVRELNAGLFAAQRLGLTSKLDVTAGLRVDYLDNEYDDRLLDTSLQSHTSIASPKLNFNYTLNDRVQLYVYSGRGFHSNDTRVSVQQNGKKVAPPAWGADLGGIFKPVKNLVIQSALWYLWLDQEFIYVGDEGVVEAGGKTRRIGLDLSARVEIVKSLFADVDLSISNPRALDVPKEESYLPLSPRFTSTGGLTYRKLRGLNGSLRYRYMGNRPANEDNSVVARGYFIVDAALNYTQRRWEAGLSVQNLLDSKWKETQFDTESRLANESAPVSEIHFTPGTPIFARASFTFYF
jgi:outer membrane cobalamin receptor